MTNLSDENGKPMLSFPSMKNENTGSNGFRETEYNTNKQLDFPSMEEKDETLLEGRLHPGRTTARLFSPSEIDEAVKIVRFLGNDETKTWLRNTGFGNDPIIIQSILKFGRTDMASRMEEFGVKSINEDPETTVILKSLLQDNFELAIMSGRNECIETYGEGIEFDRHPSDEGQDIIDQINHGTDTDGDGE